VNPDQVTTDQQATPETPAGWYQDPEDQTGQRYRYWDGSQWSQATHEYRSLDSSDRVKAPSVRWIAAGGGLALAASPFLSWADVILLGDLNLFQLLRAGGNSTGLAWLAVGVGLTVAFTAYAARKLSAVRLTAIFMGLLAGFISIVVLTGMTKDAEEAAGLVQIAWGPWIAVGGCVAMIIAGVLPQSSRDRTRRDAGSAPRSDRDRA
jgi:hypothetical protein